MIQQARNILALIILSLFLISCASHKPKGMRKSRKKDCDCPSFGMQGQINTKQTVNLNGNGETAD